MYPANHQDSSSSFAFEDLKNLCKNMMISKQCLKERLGNICKFRDGGTSLVVEHQRPRWLSNGGFLKHGYPRMDGLECKWKINL
jgi:hypothetical protein